MAEQQMMTKPGPAPSAAKVSKPAMPKVAKAAAAGSTTAKSTMTSARPTNVAKASNASKLSNSGAVIVAVRIRGMTGMHPRPIQTMDMLNLKRSNHATIVFDNPAYKGMLQDVKDFVTFGAVNAETVEKLLQKRGRVSGRKLSEVKKPEEIKKMASELMAGKSLRELGIDRYFRLTPPSGGFKSKKKSRPYGDLGIRSDMDALLKRMM
ncbi:MAG: uL30 family ribosomal protein [Candidatus Micrarchaeota archaeon]|nr:uL30 family ribosomal protein [Candidatus Micrarchaeota archaeon]